MQSFAELLTKYTQRTGITDSELARHIGVRRQTIFRWKEGIVARPRHRDDLLRCAKRLRLTPAELDEILLAAGFPPEGKLDAQPAAETELAIEDSRALDQSVNGRQDESEASSTPSAALLSQSTTDLPLEREGTELGIAAIDTHMGRRISRRWLATGALLALSTVLVAIVAFSGALGTLLPDIPGVNPPAPTLTTVPPTATAVPTATRASPSIIARPGETLLLVAQFGNYTGNTGYNVAGRIQDALQTEIDAAELGPETKALIWREEVGAEQHAAAIVAQSRAAMLIWGEYDSGRVVVNFAIRGDLEDLDIEKHLKSPADLSPTINADIPKEVQSLALLTLGRLYLGEEKIAPARNALERALRANPSEQLRSEIHFHLGRAYGAESSTAEIAPEIDKSIAQYTKAVEIRPFFALALYNRGNAYLNRYRLSSNSADKATTETDLDRAIDDYTSTIKMRPSYIDAYINRGIAYYQRNLASDIAAAIADFDRAIALDPDRLLPYYNRGLARIRQGGSTEWQADLEKVLELDPSYLGAHTALCWGYALDGQPELALDQCQKAVALAPDVGNSYDSLGLVYAQLGRSGEAIDAFKKYLAWLRNQSDADYARYNGPLVEEWIAELEASNQPITTEVLEGLR